MKGYVALNTLLIPLSTLTERGVSVEATVDCDALRPSGARDVFAGEVTVTGTVTEVSETILFTGAISGNFTHPCDRCLVEARISFAVDALWSFRKQADSEERKMLEEGDDEHSAIEKSAIHGTEIDLGPRVWEELVLATPAKFLCKEDCAGMCHRCGVNLNLEPCGCNKIETTGNTGLTELSNMFPDLAPRSSEE